MTIIITIMHTRTLHLEKISIANACGCVKKTSRKRHQCEAARRATVARAYK